MASILFNIEQLSPTNSLIFFFFYKFVTLALKFLIFLTIRVTSFPFPFPIFFIMVLFFKLQVQVPVPVFYIIKLVAVFITLYYLLSILGDCQQGSLIIFLSFYILFFSFCRLYSFIKYYSCFYNLILFISFQQEGVFLVERGQEYIIVCTESCQEFTD